MYLLRQLRPNPLMNTKLIAIILMMLGIWTSAAENRGQGSSRVFEALIDTRGTFACPRFPTSYSTKQPAECLAALRRPCLGTIPKTPP